MGILRARNMLLIVVFVYAVMTISMLVSELSSMSDNVTNMKDTIILAADMSLSQAVASDEFFNDQSTSTSTVGTNDLYRTNGVTSVQTAATVNKTTYSAENLFSLVYDFNDNATTEAEVAASKELLYEKMYGKSSNSILQNENFMATVCKITTYMPSLHDLYGGNGYLPNIARIGLLQGLGLGVSGSSDYLNTGSATVLSSTVKAAVGEITTDNTVYDKYNVSKDWLKLLNVIKSYTDSSKNTHTYMLAPTNVGITYIDPYILETAFVSNMDLLMRGGLSDLTDGVGVVENGYSGNAQIITNGDANEFVTKYNIINNGSFTFVKGELKAGNGGWTGGYTTSHTAVVPEIQYVLINAKNTDTDTMRLMHLAVGLPDSVVDNGNYKVDEYKKWLTDIGVDMTSTEPYYVLVARINFFADAFVSYNTTIARDLYSMFVRNEQNNTFNGQVDSLSDGAKGFFQVRDNIDGSTYLSQSSNDTATSAITDLPYYVYTTYYAVMP
jgi:hypothetical protein